MNVTISEKGGRWFVSLQVKMEIPEPPSTKRPIVGVDLGINRMAQLSDGTYFENPRALKSVLTKMKRQDRVVSRRKKGSANYTKALRQLARTHAHIANIRRDALHKATTWLTKTKSVVVLEDLNVKGMIKNPYIAQAISDVGLYEFRRQLTYKGAWYSCQVWLADQFYPSTKRCSQCGKIKERVALNEQMYQCDCCGALVDRDLNSAINLEQLITQTTASSAGSYACGEHIRPGFPAMLNETGTKQNPLRGSSLPSAELPICFGERIAQGSGSDMQAPFLEKRY